MEYSSNPSEIYTKQDALVAYGKITDGARDPAELDLNNPEVMEANRIYDAWMTQVEEEANLKGTDESKLLKELELTSFFVDAGFRGADYLDEVANEWLSQTLGEAEDKGLDSVAFLVQARIDSINAMIAQ